MSSRRADEPCLQKVDFGAPVHLTLDQLEFCDLGVRVYSNKIAIAAEGQILCEDTILIKQLSFVFISVQRSA